MSRRTSRRGSMPSRPIRAVLDAARAEAELARHGYVGIEHLLLALTRPEAPTAQLLAQHGIGNEPTRESVRLVVSTGRGDGPGICPAALLATIGIDLGQIRRQVQEQFGPHAIQDLYASPVGWNLRPRGPLCELGLAPQLKRVLDNTLGRCWDSAPPRMHEHLLLSALDSNSAALTAVLDELDASTTRLRATVIAQLQIAS